MSLLTRLFTWWNGASAGTRIGLSRAREAGRDAAGNVYYVRPGGRRMVIYNGVVDASRIPPDWHLWMHGADIPPPSDRPIAVPAWVKPHQPNLTGTPRAHMPQGALAKAGVRARATGDYEPWSPGE